MNRQAELEKAERTVKETENRLSQFKNAIENIDKEIAQLAQLEVNLEYNIKFLRKKSIIALAQEYKKAKEDLVKTKTRLSMMRIDRQNMTRACEEGEIFLQKAKENLAKLLKGSDNVIKGKFGKKSDG